MLDDARQHYASFAKLVIAVKMAMEFMLSIDAGIIKMHLDVVIKDITIKGQGVGVKIG